MDAVLIALLALLSGETESLAVWLLPLFCPAATLALAIGPGVKAVILSALVVGWLTAVEGASVSDLTDSEAVGPLALAVAVVAVAGALAPVNERELRRRRERLATLHGASVAFVGADDAPSLTRLAEEAARTLLPGWEVGVRLGDERVEERRWRDDSRAFLELPVVARNRKDGSERSLGAITASHTLPRVGRPVVRGETVIALRTLAAALSAALVQRELLQRLEHLRSPTAHEAGQPPRLRRGAGRRDGARPPGPRVDGGRDSSTSTTSSSPTTVTAIRAATTRW